MDFGMGICLDFIPGSVSRKLLPEYSDPQLLKCTALPVAD
jgi:hypothetical protein